MKAYVCLLLIVGGAGIQDWPSGDGVYCCCAGIYCSWYSEGTDV